MLRPHARPVPSPDNKLPVPSRHRVICSASPTTLSLDYYCCRTRYHISRVERTTNIYSTHLPVGAMVLWVVTCIEIALDVADQANFLLWPVFPPGLQLLKRYSTTCVRLLLFLISPRLITVTENRGGKGRDRFFLFGGRNNDNGNGTGR